MGKHVKYEFADFFDKIRDIRYEAEEFKKHLKYKKDKEIINGIRLDLIKAGFKVKKILKRMSENENIWK